MELSMLKEVTIFINTVWFELSVYCRWNLKSIEYHKVNNKPEAKNFLLVVRASRTFCVAYLSHI